MRTTVNLDADVAAAVAQMQSIRHVSLSAAVNELARRGLAARPGGTVEFVQRVTPLGLKIDVSNVAEALDLLDGTDHP